MNFHEHVDANTGAQTCIHQLDGMPELVMWAERLNNAPMPETEALRRDSAAYTSSYDVTGTHSLAHSIELAKNGWPQGVRLLEKASAQVNLDDFNLSTHPEPYFDVVGEEVDMGQYLTNERDVMVAYNMTEDPRNKNLEVIVEGIVPGRVSTEHIIGRGVGILAGIQALQSKGFSVGVTYATAINGHPDWGSSKNLRSEYYIPLQELGATTDVDTLAFALVNPSMLRRMMFAAYETIEPDNVKRGLGIGLKNATYDPVYRKYSSYGVVAHQKCLLETSHPSVVIPYEMGLSDGPAAAQAITNLMVKTVVDSSQQGW